MSAIKKFFEKKKAEAKFKLAGPGQKLGDAQSAAASQEAKARAAAAAAASRNAASTSRAGLSSQQAQAASAALNRLDQSSSGDFEKKRSQAHIRAMAHRELEKEKKREEEIAKLKETYGEKAAVELEGPSMLGCDGVFYKCPLIDDGRVLPKNEMKQKIRDFLYAQLETEDKGLSACLIIHTLNKDADKVKLCVDTLTKYLDNIIQNPSEEKFRKIRKSNKAFVERVSSLEGADIFLGAVGFEVVAIDGQDFWKFPDYLLESAETCIDTLEKLQTLKDALHSAAPIKAELDRGLRILLPSEASKQMHLPPDFFSVSADEIKREQQARTEAVEREGMLRTKAMREREEQREKRKYRFTLIRIRFPDGLVLQGTFSVYEKYAAVTDFVNESLECPLPFVLHDASHGGKLDTSEASEKLLIDLKLVPSAILTFAWHPDVAKEVDMQLRQSGESPAYLHHELVGSALSRSGSSSEDAGGATAANC